MHATRFAAVAALPVISFAPSAARAYGLVGERLVLATISVEVSSSAALNPFHPLIEGDFR